MVGQGFTTCLWFDTQAEEAANHYTIIFPNSSIGQVAHYGEAGPGPTGMVMTIEFELNGQKFLGLNGGPQFQFNEAISFVITCADQQEVDYYWEKLTDGGEPGPCGWLKDKFGVSWQVTPSQLADMMSDPDPEKAKRVTEKMLTMGKLNIAELQQAQIGKS